MNFLKQISTKTTVEQTFSWGKADPHVHTNFSDGYLSPLETIKMIAERSAIDVVAITDHDTTEGALIARDYARRYFPHLDVIVGQEVTTGEGDVLALFVEKTLPRFATATEAIVAIHQQHGLAVAVHPFVFGWEMESVGRAILSLPFDAVEVRHGCPVSIPGNLWAGLLNWFGPQLPRLGSSDSHIPFTIGQAFTWFPGQSAAHLRRAIESNAVRPGGTTWKIISMWRFWRFLSRESQLIYKPHRPYTAPTQIQNQNA